MKTDKKTISFAFMKKPMLWFVLLFLLSLWCMEANATNASAMTLSTIKEQVGKTIIIIATILTYIALITGIGFIMASFFKFHQHKLNPTQVPISQGVVLLLIGAALLSFFVWIPIMKNAVVGSASMNKIGGTEMSQLISGK